MMKRFLSILLSISILASFVNVASAAGTVKDVSQYAIDTFDFDQSTAAGETEFWTSGSHTRTVDGTVQTISGTGNTSNSNAVFYGLKKNGSYIAVPIFDNTSDNKIFRISFELTNNLSADAKLQLGFNPLNSSNGSNGRNYIYQFNLKNGEITSTGGSKSNVTCPVGTTIPVNMIMDLKTGASRLYVGRDEYISNGNVFQTSGRNIKSAIFWVDQAANYNYSLKDLSFTVYSAETTMDEVAAYAYGAGESEEDPGYVLGELDFIESTPAQESEFWVSGSHTKNQANDILNISGTGNTSNSNAAFFGLKQDGQYRVVPIFDSTSDDKIFRISFEFTNKLSANANLQLGFNPLNSSNGSNGRNYVYKFNLSNGSITSTGGATSKVTCPVDSTVKVNMLMNLKTGESRLYVGKNSYISNGNVFQSSGRYIKSAIFWVDQAVNYNYDLKNLSFTVYSADVTMDDIAASAYEGDEEVETETVAFETDENGYGDFEVEDYENCYNPDAWRIYESRRLFSGSKALSVVSENKNYPSDNEEPTLNLSFKANKSGKNTYYMWIRHTASVANQSGQNCYLSKTKDGSYTTFTFSAEKNAPQWICLGSVEASEGETGYVRIRHRQQNHIAIDRYVVTTDGGFIPTDAYYSISPANSSTAYSIPASSFSNGRVSFEAESTTYTSPYGTYSLLSHIGTYGSSSNFSGKNGLITSSDASTTFTTNWEATPHIEFNFTPTKSGSKYLWARIYSTTVNKDFAVSVNCSEYTQVSPTTANQWYWQLISVIDGAQANLPVNVRLYNVGGGYAFDMFAISESVFDTPSDKITWIAQSETLTSPYSTPTVSQSEVTALSHPRIYFTKDEVSSVRATLSASENATALSEHNSNVTRGKASKFTGSLAVVPGYANNSASFLGVIESLALEYALKGDLEAGKKAVSSVINYVSTVSYASVQSDELTRVAGKDIEVLSRIYDWCYDLLTAEQKNAIIKKCTEIAYQLEIGWPPENLSAVTGFGAEGSLQNYLLTFAIAVADERPDIYNYVLGRIQDEYIPAKKIMNESGESVQGSRYGTFRGHHDLTAALLLNTIGYEDDVYGEGLEDLVNWYIYARRPDGMLFVDGDDTNNGKTAGSYYSVGHMRYAFVVAARLFNNPYFKNEAKKATNNFKDFEYGEGYLSPAAFLAINRPSTGMVTENGYPLSKFFGSPNGNMIARTGWTESPSVTDDTAVAFMKTGEKNVSNHQHLDAGNFQLYYKGILANDPTYYDGSNYNSEYLNMYAKRSVAHNTVLVRDGVSRELNGHSIADGGQVPQVAPSDASGIKTVAKTEAYDFGGDDVNQPDYSYMKSDLTGAYSSSSVSDYNRSFMFLNMYDEESPAALVVFDRLNTKNASHKTAWLLHGLNSPAISGNRSVFTVDGNGYTGKMTNDTLLPANPSITTVEDGYVTAGGTKYSSGYTSSNGVCESEGYRIEVSPSSQSTLTYYLNVIQLSDASSDVVTPSLIEDDTFAGALLKDRVVLFSKSGDLIGTDNQEYTFNFAESNGYLCKIAVADVSEGTWEISYSSTGADGSYNVLTQAATSRMGEDKGCTISFAGMAGYYKIKRISAEYTSKTAEISEENTIKQLSPAVKVTNDSLYVAPRTYDSFYGVSNGEYSYKQVIAVYDEDEDELLAVKIVDDFTETDKIGEYHQMVGVDELENGAVIKTFLFEDFNMIKPVTDFGKVIYR